MLTDEATVDLIGPFVDAINEPSVVDSFADIGGESVVCTGLVAGGTDMGVVGTLALFVESVLSTFCVLVGAVVDKVATSPVCLVVVIRCTVVGLVGLAIGSIVSGSSVE